MTDLITYYLRMAAAMDAYAEATRLEASAIYADPHPPAGDEVRLQRILAMQGHAASYAATAKEWRRMAEDEERKPAA